jgi:hypothetical protein
MIRNNQKAICMYYYLMTSVLLYTLLGKVKKKICFISGQTDICSKVEFT